MPVSPPPTASITPSRARKLNLLLRLQELNTKTLTNMPRYVTMHQPGSRVISRERDDDPTTSREERDVTTRRVVEIELGRVGRLVEDTGACAEDEEVVAGDR